jgi:hypothetical protein
MDMCNIDLLLEDKEYIKSVLLKFGMGESLVDKAVENILQLSNDLKVYNEK